MNANLKAFQPIGIFDSGVGGLTVLDVLRKKFPGEDFIYLGDTANMPYGNMTQDELYHPIHQSMDWLFKENGVKFVVIACNTARSALTRTGELEYVINPRGSQPIMGPIAPVCRWVGQSDLRRIGVIATVATMASGIYPETMSRFNDETAMFIAASQDLAREIEEGRTFTDEACLEELHRRIEPLLSEDIDALVLGCTHYPHIIDSFRKVLPDGIALLNPANHMPDALWTHLDIQGLMNPRKEGGTMSFSVTGDPKHFLETARKLPLKYIDVDRVAKVTLSEPDLIH